MATSTTNLGLIKPAGTDKIRIAQINGNMDIIDEKVGAVGNTSLQTQVTGLGVNLTGLEDCVGIVVDGAKSAVAASAGQYIVLKNSIISGCDDGLYTAAQAIPADTTIDSTYLTAVSGGGLNALNTQISSFGYYTLSNETTLTSSYETINTYNSRKFSDYDLLVVVYYRGSWITGSDVVIMNQFVGMTGITKYVLYDNVGIEYDVKFTSDTSFDCKKITTDTASEKIKLYGINIDIGG